MIGCTLCGTESIIRVALSEGCQAHPEVLEQELCPQHLLSVVPVAEMETLVVRRPELVALVGR